MPLIGRFLSVQRQLKIDARKESIFRWNQTLFNTFCSNLASSLTQNRIFNVKCKFLLLETEFDPNTYKMKSLFFRWSLPSLLVTWPRGQPMKKEWTQPVLVVTYSAMIDVQASKIRAPSTLPATLWGSRPHLVALTKGMNASWPAPIPRLTGPALRIATLTSSHWWVHFLWSFCRRITSDQQRVKPKWTKSAVSSGHALHGAGCRN